MADVEVESGGDGGTKIVNVLVICAVTDGVADGVVDVEIVVVAFDIVEEVENAAGVLGPEDVEDVPGIDAVNNGQNFEY